MLASIDKNTLINTNEIDSIFIRELYGNGAGWVLHLQKVGEVAIPLAQFETEDEARQALEYIKKNLRDGKCLVDIYSESC